MSARPRDLSGNSRWSGGLVASGAGEQEQVELLKCAREQGPAFTASVLDYSAAISNCIPARCSRSS
ncbi:MAG: hypothetical protein HY901_10675, partial [Deltaproteobacteria bacterium]|nr:hypothetical protein [Deltaproteobacteria bacterium]